MATQCASSPARLQFTTEFAKTNNNNNNNIKKLTLCIFTKFVPTLSKQSTAEYGRRLCLFCPSNKLTFDLLTLKVMSESRVTRATSVPVLVFL